MKVAGIDLGSNTFLCLIAEVEDAQIKKVHADEVEVVRLGQGLGQSKNFHPDALARASACLKKFSELIQKHRPEKVLAMATSAARDAENREELFKICHEYKIPVEIIPGDKEAAITYEGAVSGLSVSGRNRMVIDIGGGSTEFIFGRDQKLVRGASYNIGSVRLTEKFISRQPTSDAEVAEAISFIDQSVDCAVALRPDHFQVDEIIAVAGTPTTLVAAQLGKFDPQQIDGFQLTREGLENWLRRLQKATIEEKMKMGLPQGRADVMLIGVLILWRTLVKFNLENLFVSTRGVRYGVALEVARRSAAPN